MKKKEFILIISIFSTLLMVGSSIQAGSIDNEKTREPTLQTTSRSYQFSLPSLHEDFDYTAVLLTEATGYRNIPGEPILPLLRDTIELPFGARIQTIQYNLGSIHHLPLTQKITPAIAPVPFPSEHKTIQYSENTALYTANEYFPNEWNSYRLTGGLNSDNILKTFLTIQINPVRYNPIEHNIQAIDSINIQIIYEQPTKPLAMGGDSYDMIIICHDPYTSLLQPLVEHKNNKGIQTKLISMQDIYEGTYFPVTGRDNPEKIKYFIKNAKETWNITYVMLVGNHAQVPIRYSNLVTDADGAYEEAKFATDLYYADLYDANGSFSSWDTDNDGIYAEWPYPEWQPQEDILDMVPDVHLGRLACMFKTEVKTVVNKIISYENTAAGKDWFTRMVVMGGDTFDKSWEAGTDYNEGEEHPASVRVYAAIY